MRSCVSSLRLFGVRLIGRSRFNMTPIIFQVVGEVKYTPVQPNRDDLRRPLRTRAVRGVVWLTCARAPAIARRHLPTRPRQVFRRAVRVTTLKLVPRFETPKPSLP